MNILFYKNIFSFLEGITFHPPVFLFTCHKNLITMKDHFLFFCSIFVCIKQKYGRKAIPRALFSV